jgi:hypothetical protein
MKKSCLLLLFLFWAVLPLMAGCSDYDDQPGIGRNATPTVTATATVAPTPTATATPTPTPEPGGWVWRLVETKLNPEQKPDEFCPEKPWRCAWFTVSEGRCQIDKIETQTVTGTKVYEYQIDCSCSKPPEEVWPGEEYRLQANCASELKYAAEGNSLIEGQMAVCYYGVVNPAHNQFLQPYGQHFRYAPWHPDYDGAASHEWVLFGPWGELGDEFELIARCGEDACQTHWRYTLQIDE